MSTKTKTLTVTTNPAYQVLIGSGLRKQVGELVKHVIKHPCSILLVADSNVNALYGDEVELSLAAAGFTVFHHSFLAGEASKNITELTKIWQTLADLGFSRSDCVVALGGGVTGDLAGLAAATYLRGIACIQMPTTVMAAIDACLGGKTAVNLPAGKNLVGSFSQPALVICDYQCWQTLPPQIYLDGLAEAVKYGVLADKQLLEQLQNGSYQDDIADFALRCLSIKAQYVMQDEHDNNQRQLLNFGHTIGHAIEHCSDYTISHGQAVAIGMAIEARAALAMGICDAASVSAILTTLKKLGLPTTTDYTAAELTQAALADKKRRGGEIILALPQRLQECCLYPLPVEQLEEFIASGLG